MYKTYTFIIFIMHFLNLSFSKKLKKNLFLNRMDVREVKLRVKEISGQLVDESVRKL